MRVELRNEYFPHASKREKWGMLKMDNKEAETRGLSECSAAFSKRDGTFG